MPAEASRKAEALRKKVLVVYDSRTGNTEEMAKAVESGARNTGTAVRVKKALEATTEDLEWADGIILGSPTHFGTMSENMKKLIGESVKIRGRLEGKIGAAFTSSGGVAGGNETTLISLLQAMLIHGMVVTGDPIEVGGHYGAVAIGKPGKGALEACQALGSRVGELVARITASEPVR